MFWISSTRREHFKLLIRIFLYIITFVRIYIFVVNFFQIIIMSTVSPSNYDNVNNIISGFYYMLLHAFTLRLLI
jgi:hypothetical protein